MSDTGMEAPRKRRDVLALALLFVAFLAAHQVGLRTITPASPLSPVWPPAGVALGAFILLPRRTWWWGVGVIIASDAVSNAIVGVRMWVGLSYLVPSLAEVGVALYIINRIAGEGFTFRRVRDTFALVVGAMLGASIGGGIAALIARLTAGAPIGQSFETWWTADVLGMLLVTPLVVAWTRGAPSLRSVPIARATEGVLFLLFWSWGSFLIFRGDFTIGWLRPHPYMLASLMVWASFRLGIRGVSAAMTSVAVIAISVVLSGAERFPLGGGTLAEHLFLVQVFLVIMGITGLLLASALDEGRAATEEARQYADRLKVLGDNLPNGVIYQLVEEPDGSRRFVHVSASVARVNGLVADDVLRDASLMYNQIHEDDRARVAAAEEVSRRDLSVFSVETRVRRADGEERWALISSTPRRAGDGRTMWDGIQIDTTARRLAEDRLRRANRALRTISACNQVLVRATSEHELLHEICRVIVAEGGFRLAWVGYAENGEEKRVIPVAHEGYEAGYLESLDIRWNDSPRGRGPTGTTIRTGEPSICHDFLTDPSVAPWRADAIARGYRASAVLPLRDQQRVFGTLSVYAPETGAFDDEEMTLLAELADDLAFGLTALREREERAQVEHALSASEERFRQLAENIREIFWMVDTTTGELLYISPGVERLYGLTVDEMRRDPGARVERIHPEDRDRVLRGIDAVMRGGIFDDEHRVTHISGEVHWVHGRAFPVRNPSGEVYRMVGITDDITARKRIEEQLRQVQKLEAIGQLAGGVAHDFNNILGAILMQTGLARSLPGTNPEISELLQDVEASAQRAANLTRQLLLFSRKQVMQPREVELNDLVATLARMLRRVVPENVQLKLAMHPRSLTVQADAGMLEQVVMNLTVNARDAMPDGGELAIETFSRTLTADDCRPFPGTTPGVYNGVRVRDSGTGIAPEHREQIFDPFFTTKEPGKGTGLGLPTVFGIVQQHRGVILVSSTVGQGSVFEILLPAQDMATPAVVPTIIPSPPVAIPLRDATILVVEDDMSLRVMTQRILERHGFRVHTARSGREALTAWDRYEPRIDLLLTDMVMPEGVSGAELASALQARDPRLRVVFSSGYDPEHGTHKLRLEPGVNLLQKPSTPRQIVEIVTQMLDGSAATEGPTAR